MASAMMGSATEGAERHMRTRTLGTDGPTVSEIGLGCMGMSEFYGRVDADDARRTLDAALAAGVSLWDSADFYGSGHNEMLHRCRAAGPS